ncbi:hypothetical protein [Natronorubrum tibetense]|uniref:Uncharacterized protein n=1 Tax=Natronorubrum tibetense GA33 TaxID=1114856 RepID=L9VS11_9EURY|nr:hypothetical protein [Natronorubrum tibetense]ELY39013.1 hypothetical protein C496_16517 [Natronorubrum tibetense GA33]
MTSELQLDFDVDPESQIELLAEIVREEYPPAKVRDVEEVIAVDGGPIDYLGWLALEDYEEHCFFYKDEEPDQQALRWLLSISPQQSDMPQLKRFLRQSYESYAESDHGVVIEISDTFLPGSTPKANIGFYHNPITDDVNSGIVTTPVNQQKEILADVSKLVPARDLETFVLNTARTLRTELRKDAERHTLEGDVSSILEQDPNFRRETVRDLPQGIHPGYVGTEVELWQKPVSRIDYLDGAQGFVQIWMPIADDDVCLLSVTRGEFNRESAIDEVRSTLSNKIQQ